MVVRSIHVRLLLICINTYLRIQSVQTNFHMLFSTTKAIHPSATQLQASGLWLCFTASSFTFLTPDTLSRYILFRQKSIQAENSLLA